MQVSVNVMLLHVPRTWEGSHDLWALSFASQEWKLKKSCSRNCCGFATSGQGVKPDPADPSRQESGVSRRPRRAQKEE